MNLRALCPRNRWSFFAAFAVLALLPTTPRALASSTISARSELQETRETASASIVVAMAQRASATAAALRELLAWSSLSVFAPEPVETVHVSLFNANAKTYLELDLGLDGSSRLEDAAALKEFFRCRRTGRYKPMAQGVLALLADVAKQFPGQVVEVVSGYRAPPYGAPHSKHFRGHAIDLRVRGVKLAKVRDTMWVRHSGIGLGFYAEQRFIHVDYRPEQGDTAWTAKHEGATYKYNPRWARQAREKAAKLTGAAPLAAFASFF